MRISRTTARLSALALAGVSSLALVAACGQSGSTASSHSGSDHNSHADPMPSASGTMAGEHHADAGKGLRSSEDGYTLKAAASALAVGQQTVRFQILDPQGKPQTDYVNDQTKPLHFYLVRLDLTGYQHLHPTLDNGTWSITVEAAAPGPYRLYTDFIAKDSMGKQHPLVLSTLLTAPGKYTPTPLPPAGTTATADGLAVSLSGTPMSGMASKVTFQVTQNGKPVTDLDQYLDSFAHLTALHVGDAAYQHVHPELTASPGQKGGPALPFSIDLPETGTWRLFLQIQRSGTLHLLPLTITVG
jgi:hypothetical protein